VKFLIDVQLSPHLAHRLTLLGHEAVHATQVGLGRATDSAILEFARRESQVVITVDLDFPRLLALTHASTPGLILFRGGEYRENVVFERLVRAFELLPSGEFVNSIVVIQRDQIRLRRLPVDRGDGV